MAKTTTDGSERHGGDVSLGDQVARILRVAWRRRFELLIPFLIMLPVSYGAALIMPQKFVARSLILFQDQDPENPLAKVNGMQMDRMADRIAGIRALLKSENVLNRYLDQAFGDKVLSPAERSFELMQLQSAIEVDNVGNNLLEFRLSGSPATGLGAKLDAILTHFLEGYRTASPHATPERIVTIDPPSDPTRPVRGKLVIFLIGVLAGALIGVAVAAIREIFDHTLRTNADFERATGLPVIARLPTPPPVADGR